MVFAEALLLFFFFSKILQSTLARKTPLIFTILFLIIWAAYFRKLGTTDYVNNAVTFENISIIILSILYFFEQINQPEPEIIYNKTLFWVVVAYLIYSAGTFFLYIYLPYLSKEDQVKYYNLNYGLSIFKNTLLAFAFTMKGNEPSRKKFQLT